MANPTSNASAKKNKNKGPLRLEATLPFLIFTALTAAYFTLFFDHHLKKGIEWGASQANGAEVNIGALKTSFIHGSFSLKDLEVTDPAATENNRIQIGQIQFKFLWDALLRAKIVIELAEIADIEVQTKRSHPGKLIPPSSDSDNSGQSILGQYLSKTKEQLSGAAIADAGKILEGLDPTRDLKNTGHLKSVAKANALKAELSKKEADWNHTLASIPGQKEFTDIQSRLNNIKPNTNNPAESAAKISEVKSVIQNSEAKINSVKTLGEKLNQELNQFQKNMEDLNTLTKTDQEELEKKLKLPSIDAKALTSQLFGPSVLKRVEQLQQGITLARQHMPTQSKSDARKSDLKPIRAVGKNYHFPITTAYPLFWLKKAIITSKGNPSGTAGEMSGEALHFSSSPQMLSTPATLHLKAEFAKKELHRIVINATFDHRKEVPVETLQASVGSYPIQNLTLFDSDSLKFGFSKAKGNAALQATLNGDQIDLVLDNTFNEVYYQVSAQSKILESTLQSVSKELPNVLVKAKFNGPLTQPTLGIESNLGLALERAFSRQLQAKLEEARRKLNAIIQAQIDGPKKELTAKYNHVRNHFSSEIENRKKQSEALKSQAQGKLASLTNQTNAIKTQALDQIKKKLPF